MSCPDCTTGGMLPGEPTGQVNADGSYLASGPASTAGSSSRAIVLLSDAFGLPLKNTKILADTFAQRLACDVWVPDLFAGKPLLGVDQLNLPDRAGIKMSAWDWVKFLFAVLPSIPTFIRNRPSVVDVRIHAFIQELKDTRGYGKLGAVGYCFGGAASARLSVTGYVDCVVVAHPGMFPLDLLKTIEVPSSWVCAEDDFSFGPPKQQAAEAILAARKGRPGAVEYEFVQYKGTAHGFAARPNLSLPEVKEAYEKSVEQTVNWFTKHLI